MSSSLAPADSDSEYPTPDLLYTLHFAQHLHHTRLHLRGGDDTRPLPPSLLPPNAHWTSAEKDLFFYALSTHSRLRPDLIAATIHTKTVADVCVYLDMLAAAAPAHGAIRRSDIPAASEVSEAWVALEERMAATLVAAERGMDAAAVQKERDAEIRTRRNAIRARKGQGRTAENERDRQGEKLRKKEFEIWLEGRRAEWETEDMLAVLDSETLRVMDTILREDEEATLRGTESEGTGSQAHDVANQAELDDGGARGLVSSVGDEVIDPVLLEISQPSVANTARSSPEPVAGPSSIPTPYPPFRLMTPPFAAEFLLDIPSAHAEVHTEVSTPTPDRSDIEPPLTPVSRRRYQKRIYMRRKRARAAGKVAEEVVERLKPGRKRKRMPGAVLKVENVDTSAALVPDVEDDGEKVVKRVRISVEDTESIHHPHPSGVTRLYKERVRLVDSGVDATTLNARGLGLFHLGGLAKLMRMHNMLHDVPAETATSISAPTVALLGAHVARFTAEVARRAVVIREQARRAKRHTKVWRLTESEVISAADVERALALLGVGGRSVRRHFGGLLKRLGSGEESVYEQEGGEEECFQEEGEAQHDGEVQEEAHETGDAQAAGDNVGKDDEDENEEGEEDDSEDEKGLDQKLASRTLHHTVFAPFVRLPPAGLDSTSPSTSAADDILLSDTDTDANINGDDDDAALDATDTLMDEAYERGLWAEFGQGRNGDQDNDDTNAAGQSTSNGDGDIADDEPVKKLRPRKRKLVKSSAYVLDSD